MKSLRIARISSVHGSQAIRAMYAAEPLAAQNYDEQLQRVLSQKVYYSDIFERSMQQLGHDALGIVYDIEPLQRSWAREQGLDWSREGLAGTAIAQLKAWKPDVVYFQDLFTMPHELRRKLKDLIPSVKAVVIYKGSPGALAEAAGSDLVFAATPHLVKAFQSHGLETRLLYHSFDDSIWRWFEAENAAGSNRRYPVTFAGTSGYGWGLDFQSRYWTLKLLFEKITGFEAWVDEREISRDLKFRVWTAMKSLVDACPGALLNTFAAAAPELIRRAAAQTLFWRQALKANQLQFPNEALFQKIQTPTRPLRELFPGRCHAPKYGLELFSLLGQSRIAFNRHTDVVAGYAGNIRLFEATGMGACLVTERCKNIGDLFEDGAEVVTYATAEECVEKINYLLAHPAECDRIAAAGQARTLRDHTALNRARTVSDELQKLIARA